MVPERRNNEEPFSLQTPITGFPTEERKYGGVCQYYQPAHHRAGVPLKNTELFSGGICRRRLLHSGNFETPGFRAMLEHLKTSKVNTVVSRTMSRLGRDMTESSHYANLLFFLKLRIRYLNGSNFDSEDDNLMGTVPVCHERCLPADLRKGQADAEHQAQQRQVCGLPPYLTAGRPERTPTSLYRMRIPHRW